MMRFLKKIRSLINLVAKAIGVEGIRTSLIGLMYMIFSILFALKGERDSSYTCLVGGLLYIEAFSIWTALKDQKDKLDLLTRTQSPKEEDKTDITYL